MVKIGRNAPCPCGARRENGIRKKYKNCCIKRPSPFSEELASKINEKTQADTARQYEDFSKAHAQGICYLCSLPYEQYDLTKPCSHWLLRPSGMKKDLVVSVLEQQGCFTPQALLRWLANTESFGAQINDSNIERDPKKVFETTIKYKIFEWSFTCSNSDLKGHRDSTHGKDPHFHFQMRINGKSFIDYSDYHPALAPYDRWAIRVKRNEVPGVKYQESFGAGIEDLINVAVDTNLHGMEVADNETEAQFHMNTLVHAKPGASISGDEIASIIEESNRTKIPIAKLLQRLKDVSIETAIEPGPAVIEKALRTPRKK